MRWNGSCDGVPGGKQKGAARKEKALKSACVAALRAIVSGADGRSRTGMEVIQRFLSPSTLPEASGM